jgi:filamentous hemagglutinin family protein
MKLARALSGLIKISCSLTILAQGAAAQIRPDSTLPVNSAVTTQGNFTVITGGTQAGTNLFHSFQSFSVPTGNIVYFNNGLNIQNIFSRVTGISPSQIDGIISANGSSNLFFLNPNGIIFGANARLNLGGSFYGTTAQSIIFEDGSIFSAVNPSVSPLLSVTSPRGITFNKPGSIIVKGTGHDLVLQGSAITERQTQTLGLAVRPQQTLALIGGNITLEGAIINAPGGRIEIGSVEQGTVGVNLTSPEQTLNFTGIPFRQNISLSKKALIDASGLVGRGSIFLYGKNITVADSSVILLQNLQEPGQLIRLNASDSIAIQGANPDALISSSIRSEAIGSGRGAALEVNSQSLIIDDGGQIAAQTFGPARGGDISIQAKKSIQIKGTLSFSPNVLSLISSSTFGTGNAGDVRIQTQDLLISNGGNISSGTFRQGKAGNLEIDVINSVRVTGFEPTFFAPSALLTTSFAEGKAGNLTINTAKLLVQDGGRIDSSTVASGASGSINITASDWVKVDGSIPGSLNPSSIISSANIIDPKLQQLISFLSDVPAIPSGNSGNITLTTGQLTVSNGGEITVKNDGLGDGGTLTLKAGAIFLNGGGSITASTSSGQGGNIAIRAGELALRGASEIAASAGGRGQGGNIEIVSPAIFLREGSQISAATESGNGGNILLRATDIQLAGSKISATAGGFGDGGNIAIDTERLLLLDGSEIAANAFEGRGGQIDITARGILVSPDSRITASSALGVDGEVRLNVNPLPLNPTETELPANLPNLEQLLAQSCLATAQKRSGRFEIWGEGGVPSSPGDSVGHYTLEDLIPLGQAVGIARTPDGRLSAIGCEPYLEQYFKSKPGSQPQ